MQYMGGKGRIAKTIAQVMLRHATKREFYVEPFLGGAFVAPHMAPRFACAYAGDIVPDVAELWHAAVDGWMPPDAITRDEYAELRSASPSPLRTFAGFGASFGGKWFGGYASNARGDDFVGAAKRGLLKKVENMRTVKVRHCSYQDWMIGLGDVVYCDPPYANTTTYDAAPEFDHEEFWHYMRHWSNKGAIVFVSESSAPGDWSPIWEREQRATLKKDTNTGDRVERLYVHAG